MANVLGPKPSLFKVVDVLVSRNIVHNYNSKKSLMELYKNKTFKSKAKLIILGNKRIQVILRNNHEFQTIFLKVARKATFE